MIYVFQLKILVEIELEEALKKNNKVEARHIAGLELFFDSTRKAEVWGDTSYVAFAKTQIIVVAQTICNIAL